MSGGPQPVLQAAVSDGLSLDPFSFGQDGWTASEVDDLMALRVLASRFARRLGPYLSGERRTLDFRDSPVRTPRQNPVYASWPAACVANWARNVAVAPSTPGFRARPYWQIHRPCCSRWYPRAEMLASSISTSALELLRCAPATGKNDHPRLAT